MVEDMEYNFDKFDHKLSQMHLSVTDAMKEQFCIYYDLLCEWNKVMNLTAITEFDMVVEKHFLDSVALAAYIKLDGRQKLIDIGTGAGFPGIPLKIMFPDMEVMLLDSLNKRVRFLQDVIAKLGLEKIQAVHGRAEELAHQISYRENYDLCVSRAVANLSSLCEYCLPFVKVGGVFAAYKSAGIEEEITSAKKAMQILGGKFRRVEEFQLADTEYQRSFVFVDKKKPTSKKFPRKAGVPGKNPIL